MSDLTQERLTAKLDEWFATVADYGEAEDKQAYNQIKEMLSTTLPSELRTGKHYFHMVSNLSTKDVNFDANDKDFDDVVWEALNASRETFKDTLSKYLYDSACCDIRFTAFIVDTGFTTRLRKIELEEEVKE